MSDVLDFKWYATHMQQVCNTNIKICIGHSQRNLGVSFLCISTSLAIGIKCGEMLVTYIERYLLRDIEQRRQ